MGALAVSSGMVSVFLSYLHEIAAYLVEIESYLHEIATGVKILLILHNEITTYKDFPYLCSQTSKYERIMGELSVTIKELPIGKVFENTGQIPYLPENPRRIKEEQFELLKRSIQESPVMKTLDEIKVYPYNGQYIAIGGNHRLRAYKELGWKNVLCKILPDDTPAEKLQEYIMKENMQYATNDPYKLDTWDKDKRKDWGVEVPMMESDINVDEFFENLDSHHLPQKGFKLTVVCPAALEEKKAEIVGIIKEVMKPYGGVKVG